MLVKSSNTDAGLEEFYNLDKDKQKRALQQIARNDVEMPIIARYRIKLRTCRR